MTSFLSRAVCCWSSTSPVLTSGTSPSLVSPSVQTRSSHDALVFDITILVLFRVSPVNVIKNLKNQFNCSFNIHTFKTSETSYKNIRTRALKNECKPKILITKDARQNGRPTVDQRLRRSKNDNKSKVYM